MILFIDTNIYLKFYHFTNDELEELNKLIVLMDEKKIKLFIPQQVLDEFKRNREVKIADALKTFKAQKLNNTFPAFCKEYKEYQKIKDAITEFDKNKKDLIKNLELAIETFELKADQVINEIFQKAIKIPSSNTLIDQAKLRYDLGNPPGKKKSYRDALNWECLLAAIPEKEDLYFVSDDKDYFSEIDSKRFNSFLNQEWRDDKKSEIKFYKSLSELFKESYPTIKIASELKKDILIKDLEASDSFKIARRNLHKLSDYDNFTSDQINKIMRIAGTNNQVYWISEDQDINEILYGWLDKYLDVLTDETIDLFSEKNKRNDVEIVDEYDDLPF